MEEIRIRPRERSGGSSLSYGIAFLLIAFGVLKVLESVLDDDFEGGGQIIIGCALLIPSIVSMSRGGKPHFLLSIIAVIVIVTGVINLISFDIPWFAILLILAGVWVLMKSRGGGDKYEVVG